MNRIEILILMTALKQLSDSKNYEGIDNVINAALKELGAAEEGKK